MLPWLAKPSSGPRAAAGSVQGPRVPQGPLPRRPRCSVCQHHRQREINLALLAGESTRRVSERFGPSHPALARHKRLCLPANLFEARQAKMLEAEFLLSKVIELQRKAEALGSEAAAAKDRRTALSALGECRRILELQLAIAHQTASQSERGTTNDVEVLKEAIVEALAGYPEARAAVASALAA